MSGKILKLQEKLLEDGTAKVLVRDSIIEGRGGFARKKILKGTKIIQYVGELITKKESARRCEDNNVYIFTIDDKRDLDGDVDWNPARYLNHSCNPNCEALDEEGNIFIVAKKDIKKGEELTFNYGYELEDYEDHPCQCGAKKCVGFIVAEEYFDDVKKKEKRKKATPA